MLVSFITKLSNKTQLTNNVYLFRFNLVDPPDINFKAGQYIVLEVPKDDGFVSRLYSIASPPFQKNHFELLVELIPGGIGSNYLNQLKIGDTVFFKGPAGEFIIKDEVMENNKNLIFFATGSGIAPIKSILLSKFNDPNYSLQTLRIGGQTTHHSLFWGLSLFKNVYLFDEFKNLTSQYPNFEFRICLSREKDLSIIKEEDRKYFVLGRVNAGYEQFIQEKNNKTDDYDYYICGGRGIIESLKTYLTEKGAKRIYFEKY